MGSIGAIVGGVIPGLLQEQWGWQRVFACLAIAAFVAAALLLPKWNAVPPTSAEQSKPSR
jgi:sugar phosphate permease